MMLEARSPLGQPFGAAIPVQDFPPCEVTLRERADIGCLLVNAAVEAGEIHSLASDAAGIDLPMRPGAVSAAHDRLALWLTPRSWLVHCHPDEKEALASGINGAFPDRLVHAASFTDALCWLEIGGRKASDLLKEGGFLTLDANGFPQDHAKRTILAGVAVVIVRQADARWLLGIERSRARYFVDWLKSCAA